MPLNPAECGIVWRHEVKKYVFLGLLIVLIACFRSVKAWAPFPTQLAVLVGPAISRYTSLARSAAIRKADAAWLVDLKAGAAGRRPCEPRNPPVTAGGTDNYDSQTTLASREGLFQRRSAVQEAREVIKCILVVSANAAYVVNVQTIPSDRRLFVQANDGLVGTSTG